MRKREFKVRGLEEKEPQPVTFHLSENGTEVILWAHDEETGRAIAVATIQKKNGQIYLPSTRLETLEALGLLPEDDGNRRSHPYRVPVRARHYILTNGRRC